MSARRNDRGMALEPPLEARGAAGAPCGPDHKDRRPDASAEGLDVPSRLCASSSQPPHEAGPEGLLHPSLAGPAHSPTPRASARQGARVPPSALISQLLPEHSIRIRYEAMGLRDDGLLAWQAECLSLPSSLQGNNVVYTAPTSAGKSLVGEVLLLRAALLRGRNRIALFVAPYRALCEERARRLQELVSGTNLVVAEFWGGRLTRADEIPRNSIVVATIEKANILCAPKWTVEKFRRRGGGQGRADGEERRRGREARGALRLGCGARAAVGAEREWVSDAGATGIFAIGDVGSASRVRRLPLSLPFSPSRPFHERPPIPSSLPAGSTRCWTRASPETSATT